MAAAISDQGLMPIVARRLLSDRGKDGLSVYFGGCSLARAVA